MFVDPEKRFKTNEHPTRQERKHFPRMPLGGFLVVKFAPPGNEPEVFTRGKSFLEELDHLFPAAPIVQSWPVDRRGEFKHELAKCRRRDGREHTKQGSGGRWAHQGVVCEESNDE